MSRLDQAAKAFHSEAHELLAQMEDALLHLENNPTDNGLIDSVFRAVRTIGTTGAVFGFAELASLTDLTEKGLDSMRSSAGPTEHQPVALLMACRDHIAVLVDSAVLQTPLNQVQEARHAALVQQLHHLLGHATETAAEQSGPTPASKNAERATDYDNQWHVFVEFGPDVLRNGQDPIALLQQLDNIGQLNSVKTSFHAMPAAELMDPTSCYISYEIDFRSETASKRSIEDVFRSVREDVMISILPPSNRMSDMIGAIEQLPEDVGVLGDVLARTGTITQSELDRALAEQKRYRDAGQNADSIPKLGQLLVQQKAVRPEIIDAAVEKQKKAKAKTRLAAGQLPVDANALSQLIDMVGELVVIGASARLLAQRHADGQLLNSMASMTDLAEEIRHNALRLRRG